MKNDSQPQRQRSKSLDKITTEWSLIHDPGKFVERYTLAIQDYLFALLKNRHDAEDAFQDFMLRVLQRGFLRVKQERGRFRNYLKTAVRNAAINYLERKRGPKRAALMPLHLPLSDPSQLTAEQEWLACWRKSLLEATWQALEIHQRQHPGSLCCTVLRCAVDYPQEDSHQLASRTAGHGGDHLRADAFRKQLSRARRLFARFLQKEVAQTLDHPTPEQIEEELNELGLMEYVADFLPADRPQGKHRDVS